MKHRIIAAVLLAAGVAAIVAGGHDWNAKPPRIIETNWGGHLDEFIQKYEDLRRSGSRVVLDGVCISACTLIAGLVPLDRICTTPFAKLAFHSASEGPMFSKEGTRIMWHIYPPQLRELLRTKFNWDGDGETAEHPNLIYVEGDDLATIIKAC